MEKNLIKKIALDNGLELEFYDASKKVAGDRWRVKLKVKMEIPVNNYLRDMPSGMDSKDMNEVLGEKIVFEKSIERNFVDDKEKETILNGFLDSSLEGSATYLSVSDFPKKFIVKKYKEAKAQGGWYQE